MAGAGPEPAGEGPPGVEDPNRPGEPGRPGQGSSSSEGEGRPSTAYRRLATGIGLVSGAVFAWLLTSGPGLFGSRVFSEVFDVQARAMAQGRFDVPADALAFEGFLVDGRTYTYFGIFPSLLRLPVFALTDRFDGRLTAASMLVAFAVAYVASALIVSRVRALVAPDRPWTRTGLAVAGVTLAALGIGSNLTFLASAAWVYHEAALWGSAGVLVAFAALLGYLRHGRPRHLALAAGGTAVAWLSRGSMGLAPSLVLAVIGTAHLVGWGGLARFVPRGPIRVESADAVGSEIPGSGSIGARDVGEGRMEEARGGVRRGDRRARSPRLAALALAGAALPAVAFALVNVAKFDSPTTIPFGDQAIVRISPERVAALDAYGGNLFSARLLPSATWQAVRPDTMAPSAQWPFVDFTYAQPVALGGPVWDTVEPTAGALTTMPVLLVLAGVAVVAVVRSRGRGPVGELVTLVPFVAGGAVAAAIPFTIAFIAQRYLTDAMPLLVVLAAAGVAVVDHWTSAARPSLVKRRGAVAVLAVLALAGTWVTLSATWLYQHFENPPELSTYVEGLETRARVADRLGTPAVPVAGFDGDLPEAAPRGTVAVVGDCDGLYWHNGYAWQVLESGPGRGRHRFQVRSAELGPTGWETLVRLDPGGEDVAVEARLAVGEVEVRITRQGARPTGEPEGRGGSDRHHEVVVIADPQVSPVEVWIDGDRVATAYGDPPRGEAILGPEDDGTGRAGSFAITVEEPDTPVCDRLFAASG